MHVCMHACNTSVQRYAPIMTHTFLHNIYIYILYMYIYIYIYMYINTMHSVHTFHNLFLDFLVIGGCLGSVMKSCLHSEDRVLDLLLTAQTGITS